MMAQHFSNVIRMATMLGDDLGSWQRDAIASEATIDGTSTNKLPTAQTIVS
jgi:hypothetical protein